MQSCVHTHPYICKNTYAYTRRHTNITFLYLRHYPKLIDFTGKSPHIYLYVCIHIYIFLLTNKQMVSVEKEN